MPTDPIPPDPQQIGARMVERALAHGFALAGVCEARPSDHAEAFRGWLDAGRHGEMGWLAERVEERVDPARFLPGCRSLLLVADLYRARDDGDPAPEPLDVPARIARYARTDDYHRIIKQRLHELCDAFRVEHPGHAFRAFTDTAPIFEREHAARAGLGWIGKHTLLIHPRIGSFVLLGGIGTTLLALPSDEQRPAADHCGTCTRCIDACPTSAIAERRVDASRCIAYLTIEHRSPIDPAFHPAIGDWLFGCDICQDVCPHNSPRVGGAPGPVHPAYRPRFAELDALGVLSWTAEDRATNLRRSAMKRATLAMLRRNALIVAANALLDEGCAPAVRERVRRSIEAIAAAHREDEHELVVRTAIDLLSHHPAFTG